MDTTRTITRSALRFLSGTVLSRITGLMRDIAMAFAFGTHPSVAAFLTAFRLANLFRRLLGEGAMQSAFIPLYENLRAEDLSRANHLFLNIKRKITYLLLGGIALTTLILWPLTSHHEIAKLTLLMLPCLLFICLFGINASFLQCHNRYFTAGAAPGVFNLVWIAALFFLWKFPTFKAMEYLSMAIILASYIQYQITQTEAASLIPPTTPSKTDDVKKLLTPLLLGFVGIASTQVNAAMDALFARYAESEGPAYLWYAIRLQQLPLALFGIALSNALLPTLTRAKDPVQFNRFLHYAIKWCLLLMLPTTLFIFLLGESSIQIVFERGSFTAQSTQATARCLWAYGAGLIPMALVLILAPALYAKGDYRSASRGSVVAMGMNFALNALMIFGFHYGAFSVALATSVSAWWQCGYLARRLRIEIPSIYGTVLASMGGVAIYKATELMLPPCHGYLRFMILAIAFGMLPGYYALKTVKDGQ